MTSNLRLAKVFSNESSGRKNIPIPSSLSSLIVIVDFFNAFLKKEITADSKPKADVDEDIKEQLKSIVTLWDEQSKAKKNVKNLLEELEKKTIKTIEGLDMKKIQMFLELKWIVPITSAIEALPGAIVTKLADTITGLNEKYAVTYNDIEQGIEESEQNLATLISQLTGDEFAIKGLSNLIKK